MTAQSEEHAVRQLANAHIVWPPASHKGLQWCVRYVETGSTRAAYQHGLDGCSRCLQLADALESAGFPSGQDHQRIVENQSSVAHLWADYGVMVTQDQIDEAKRKVAELGLYLAVGEINGFNWYSTDVHSTAMAISTDPDFAEALVQPLKTSH